MPNQMTYRVTGMHCAACAKTVEKELSRQTGIKAAAVNPLTEEAVISAEEPLDYRQINRSLKKLGYSLVLEKEKEESHLERMKADKEAELLGQKQKLAVSLPLAALTLVAMLLLPLFPSLKEAAWSGPFSAAGEFFAFASATLIIFWIGRGFLTAVWRFLRYGRANMDTLIGLGTGTAYFYSVLSYFFPDWLITLNLPRLNFFDVTVVVIVLVYFGKYLEAKAKRRTGLAIEKLVGLQAKTAIIEKDGREEEVPLSEIKLGDIALVKPGMKIPADGLIISGSSAIDESLITGESLPIDKQAGDTVIGATINRQGLIRVKVNRLGEESVLNTIVRAIKAAQNSRAPIQKLVDKISSVFVPLILVLASLTLAAWLIFAPASLGWDQAINLGITCFISLLAIACPCALGLATPTGIMVGLGLASQNGILVKNAAALESLGKIDLAVFDKTGTITKGQPETTDIIAGSLPVNEVLKISASLEKGSDHPLAKAVVNRAEAENLALKTVENFQAREGKGVSGLIAGRSYYLGNRKLAKESGLEIPETEAARLEADGKTIMYLGSGREFLGLIAVADQIKPEAKAVIAKLKRLGIKTLMLSGDRLSVGRYIARQAGIDEVIAEVSPLEKAEKIKELQKNGRKVAMIGDGVNDAVAMVSADVGIAMASGSDVAIESADITILGGELDRLEKAYRLSRLTMKKIKQNLFWAFFYNLVALPLAAGAFFPAFGLLLNPMVAAGAMTLSSLSVVINTLLMRRARI